jgi:hypothetical protein
MDEQRDVREVNARMESEGRAEVTVSLTVLWQSKFAYLLDDAKRLRDAGIMKRQSLPRRRPARCSWRCCCPGRCVTRLATTP